MVHSSAMELATGVAVAKVATRWPFERRSAHSLASRSCARWDPGLPMPSMAESTRRFLYRCASSTNR